MKKIASFGAGVNTVAMIIEMARLGIIPDHILFADPGAEKQETYDYIIYFNKWLVKNGMPEIETVRYKTRHGEELTLEQDVINNHTLPSISFGWKTCSQKFKILPQHKFIQQKYGDEEMNFYIGFDASERRRVKENPVSHYFNHYPLIEWGYTREKCVQIILNCGLCLPPKSSCIFCRNMKPNEVRALSDHDKTRLKFMEKNATRVAELKGLGGNVSFTKIIDADAAQLKAFDYIEMDYSLPCECIN